MTARIRRISPEDNVRMAQVIRTVMPSFGAGGKGFAIHDAEVDDLYKAYTHSRAAYFVCEMDGKILGGGGDDPS
ncbi:MAG: hypothetical protein ABIR06_18465 [Cyclobacteriaceae bacterium]